MHHDLTVPEILLVLRAHFRSSCHVAACNTYAMHRDFEADFLAVTGSGFLHEVEIKRSRADFKADAKKTARVFSHNEQINQFVQQAVYVERTKHELIQSGQLSNYFWFAMPEGLIEPEEVPEFAGLLLLKPDKLWRAKVRVARKAPRIHKTKVSDEVREQIKACMMYRAWEWMDAVQLLQDRVDRLEAEARKDKGPDAPVITVPGQLSLFGGEVHA